MIRPRVILFDLDGVLCDLWRFAALLERDYGITRAHTQQFFLSEYPKAARGERSVTDLLKAFLPRWGFPGTSEDFLSLWLESERELRLSVVQFIQGLRASGYLCGLATNQEFNRAGYLRREMGLAQRFDWLFISSEMGAMKPDSEFYIRVQEVLPCEPEKVLFIDDDERYLTGARQLGWETFQFLDEKRDLKKLGEYLLRFE